MEFANNILKNLLRLGFVFLFVGLVSISSSSVQSEALGTENSIALTAPIINSVVPAAPTISSAEQTLTFLGSNFLEGMAVVVTRPDGSTFPVIPRNLTSSSFSIGIIIHSAGVWRFQLRNPGDEQTASFSLTVMGVSGPVISSVSPPSPAPSTPITVIGFNFQPGLTVTLTLPNGGTVTISGSQIQDVSTGSFVIQVALSVERYCIRVNNPNGTVSNQFCFDVSLTAPAITSISPTSPTVNDVDQTVDVFGGNFQQGLTMTVFFPDGGSGTLSGAQIMFIDSTHIKVIVTLNLIGTYGFRVNNPSSEQSNTLNFQTQAAIPLITSVSPTNPCVRNVDQSVTVNGSGFRVGLTVLVTFPNGGSTTLSGSQIHSVTDSSFTIVITLANPGSYVIRVNNPGGTVSGNFPVPTQNCVSVAAIDPPRPNRGNTDQDVTVTGSNFVAGLTVNVIFPSGGTATLSGAQVLNVTPNSFTMRITMNASGTWSIRVRNPNGDLSNSFSFEVRNGVFDFDGDGKSDISIFRPSNGQWWLNRSTAGLIVFTFGNSADILTPGDFTGDGKTDVSVFRPSTGEWFVLRSEDYTFYSFPFGTIGDVPVPADYDGDGKADAAVFRTSNSTWYIQRSSGGTTIESFGAVGDRPVPADYDGDGKTDIAIYRPSEGQWWLNRSTAGVIVYTFGNSSDRNVPGDYTGDGKADVAIWRPSTGEWFILRSEDASFYSFPFGISTDVPVPGDYDGDGKFDAGVFRPSNGTWYLNRSTAGLLIQGFGLGSDIPVPSAFVR